MLRVVADRLRALSNNCCFRQSACSSDCLRKPLASRSTCSRRPSAAGEDSGLEAGAALAVCEAAAAGGRVTLSTRAILGAGADAGRLRLAGGSGAAPGGGGGGGTAIMVLGMEGGTAAAVWAMVFAGGEAGTATGAVCAMPR